MKVPFFDLKEQYAGLRDEILAALDGVCQNASFALGKEVEEFEREFAALCEANHCVALNSGTSALHLALLAMGVQPGDEVITSPATFLATAEAITYTGAKPVFVDVDPATSNLDPKLLDRAITSQTKAIMPVHLYGRPADMDPILAIAKARGIAVIEDACQAHGARYRGRRVGAIGDVGAFSFYPSKNLGAYGEGGAIVTNDSRIANFALAARNHGQTGRYEHEFVGYNYRMEGFQGAVLQVKMRRLADWTAKRRQLAQEYRRLLAKVRVRLPQDDPQDECVYHLFVIFVGDRCCMQSKLAERGIDTLIHYPRPLHLQPAYISLGYPKGTFPHAERAAETVLSLPLFPEMSLEQVNYVCSAVGEIAGAQ